MFFNSTDYTYGPQYVFTRIFNTTVPQIDPSGLFTALDDDGVYNQFSMMNQLATGANFYGFSQAQLTSYIGLLYRMKGFQPLVAPMNISTMINGY